jgi:hypothetical protein
MQLTKRYRSGDACTSQMLTFDKVRRLMGAARDSGTARDQVGNPNRPHPWQPLGGDSAKGETAGAGVARRSTRPHGLAR